MRYIKFTSHRARQYGLRALGGKRQGYFSFSRETGCGVYQVTEAELALLKTSGPRVKFTVLREPYIDLQPCWPRD